MLKSKTPAEVARVFDGGADRDRTDDLYTASVYQSKGVIRWSEVLIGIIGLKY
jgi:hypothetical protein